MEENPLKILVVGPISYNVVDRYNILFTPNFKDLLIDRKGPLYECTEGLL